MRNLCYESGDPLLLDFHLRANFGPIIEQDITKFMACFPRGGVAFVLAALRQIDNSPHEPQIVLTPPSPIAGFTFSFSFLTLQALISYSWDSLLKQAVPEPGCNRGFI